MNKTETKKSPDYGPCEYYSLDKGRPSCKILDISPNETPNIFCYGYDHSKTCKDLKGRYGLREECVGSEKQKGLADIVFETDE